MGWLKESGTVEGWGEGMVRLSIVEKGGGTNKEIFNYRWYIYEKKKNVALEFYLEELKRGLPHCLK